MIKNVQWKKQGVFFTLQKKQGVFFTLQKKQEVFFTLQKKLKFFSLTIFDFFFEFCPDHLDSPRNAIFFSFADSNFCCAFFSSCKKQLKNVLYYETKQFFLVGFSVWLLVFSKRWILVDLLVLVHVLRFCLRSMHFPCRVFRLIWLVSLLTGCCWRS